jgi:nucleotide-binding universal stress UspA family protein
MERTDKVRTPAANNRIVVGVDGSPSGQRALQCAAADTAATNQTLHLVHCVAPRAFETPTTHIFGPYEPASMRTPRQILAEAEESVRAAAPWVQVQTELVVGTIAQKLLEKAEGADMLVLGSRGRGHFAGLLSGSVGITAAAKASWPVVVVTQHSTPRPRSASGRIVVGIDGAGRSTRAVDFAFETAARRRLDLTAVLAWSVPFSAHPAGAEPPETIRAHGRERLIAALADMRKRYPDVRVEAKLVHAYPEDALLRESADAELVVVGSRGLGGLPGLLRGSVSQALLRRAASPVVVVRHGEGEVPKDVAA